VRTATLVLLLAARPAAADALVDTQHLRLDLRLDPARRAVEGRATLRLRLARAVEVVSLDAVGLSVRSVADGEGRALRFEASARELRVHLGGPPSGAEVTLVVDYSASPRRGLRFLEPSPARPALARQAWTSFWPEEARYVIPCRDDPTDKLTSELRLTVPRSWRAMANGALVETKQHGGERIWHYRLDQPHSPYLIAFVAGEYEEVTAGSRDVPIVYFVYRGRGEDGTRSFGRAPEILAFLSKRTGVPYPWPKLALSVAADFVHGAMENVSAITLSDAHLLDGRARADEPDDDVLAHELAHQWWGDLVTPASWNDVWLSEGLATFFTDQWIEHDLGADAAAWRRLEHGDAWKRAREATGSRAIVPDGVAEPWLMLDAHVYARPALVLAQLRALVGEAAFMDGLRTFLDRHALSNASTADFERALTSAAGRDLAWFFEQWFRRPQMPSLRVAWRWEDGRVVLSVRQEPPAFVLPVDVTLLGGTDARAVRVLADREAQEFSIPASERPLSVTLDALTHALAVVEMPKPAGELAVEVARGETAADRARAARELAAWPASEGAAALATALAEDRSWGVRVEAARALGRLGGGDALAALARGSKDRDPRVRAATAEAMAGASGAEAGELLRGLVRREASDLVVAAALRAMGAARPPGAWEALSAALAPGQAIPLRIAALNGLGSLGDARAVPLVLEQAAPGQDVRLRLEAILALGRVGRGHGVVVSRLRRLLGDSDGSVRAAAARALVEVGDAGARDALAAALAAEDHPLHHRALQAALEALPDRP
jgi:aminopeptidase N